MSGVFVPMRNSAPGTNTIDSSIPISKDFLEERVSFRHMASDWKETEGISSFHVSREASIYGKRNTATMKAQNILQK